MKFIATKTHGFIDYVVGILLIALPWILELDIASPQSIILIVLGLMALIYSVLTKYELGIIRIIPMPVHLALDIVSGLLLAVSPWLFEFSDEIYMPHLIFGLFEIVAALLTKRTVGQDR